MEQKLSIVCFSGDFDKAVAAFTLATGGAATGRPVTMFFTFWGLNLVKKRSGRTWIGKGLLARFFNFLMGGPGNVPLSRLNFGGVSPRLMRGMMKKNNVATLEDLIEAAKALNVNLVACEMSMNILGITLDDLLPEIKEVIGVSTFLDYSRDAQIIFI
ncbi:MAG: DsrE/DsrF/DrsH-like family protein [Lentisphaerae bacterium]|nr:DsrE/DsrF/DrsH-like family protein [Lentisphaerota bacterium]